jgi:hypothetical protein
MVKKIFIRKKIEVFLRLAFDQFVNSWHLIFLCKLSIM